MAACSLTLLGGFGLRSADGQDLALSTRKDRLLLAYLALNSGRALPRDRLAGLLWGDRGEVQARDSLRQSLAAIRQAFRHIGLEPISSERESVSFHAAGIEVDATLFDRLASEPGSQSQAAALLYRGALLDGIDGMTSDFEAWLGPERERLASIAVRLVEQLANSSVSSEPAICLARQLLARDSLCEPVYRALMRLYVASGDRAAALKLYATSRKALEQELGVAPDIRTEELYRDILTDRLLQPSNPSQTARPADQPSIAVLPFSKIGGDPDTGQLCDGITEDIITGLGRFHMLFVIDRHSSAAVCQQATDISDIGRRLGVAYVVQGSIQRLAEQARITVRLVEVGSRAQRWGHAYDIPFSEILAISDKVTSAIVSTLYDRVESSLLEQSRQKPTLAAYECLLRGIKHLRGYGPDDNKRALEMFRQAMELDPDYALARAYRGLAEVIIYDYEAPDIVLAEALSLAASAVDLDGGDSRCQWVLAQLYRLGGNFEAAERHYRRALALNPNDANAIAGFGRMLASVGRWEEAIDRVREAMRLNPYHPDWYWQVLGAVLFSAGRYGDAVEAFGQAIHRGFWSRCYLAACFALMDRLKDAAAEVAEARRLRPDCSLAKMRTRDFSPADSDRFIEALRKAGLPE